MFPKFWQRFEREIPPDVERIQGVWIAGLPHSPVFASPENIRQALDFLQESGFTTVFPVVWTRGYTLFRSRVTLDRGLREIDPYFEKNHFDPLQIFTEYAIKIGLKIIPWFEYGFAASHLDTGGEIFNRYPDWRAIDRHGRSLKQGGLLWMNALDCEVQEFLLSLLLEVARNYEIEGVQGCDRLPALPVAGGYNPDVIRDYQKQTGTCGIPEPNDPRWIQWRADRLTEFLARVYGEIKAIDPALKVSLSPAVYPFCLNHLLQDPKGWIDRKIVDILHPQIYRHRFSSYRSEARKQKAFLGGNPSVPIAPGVAFTANGIALPPRDLSKIIHCNRRLGFNGQVFFHYEGLRTALPIHPAVRHRRAP